MANTGLYEPCTSTRTIYLEDRQCVVQCTLENEHDGSHVFHVEWDND